MGALHVTPYGYLPADAAGSRTMTSCGPRLDVRGRRSAQALGRAAADFLGQAAFATRPTGPRRQTWRRRRQHFGHESLEALDGDFLVARQRPLVLHAEVQRTL